MTSRAVHAVAVVVGDGAPVRDGAVVVDERGEVQDVGPAAEVLPRHAGIAIERVQGVVFPGLVNAHTHIELSAYRGKVTGGRGFVDWVDRFVGLRAETPAEEEAEGIGRGVAELETACTAAVGDVTNSLGAVHPLARAGIGGCVFHEVFGVNRAQVMARVEGLRRELEERVGRWPTTDLAYAPAPHTIYTTHPDAVRALLESARSHGARTSVHLAEHPAERRAIELGDGPSVAWLLARARGGLEWPCIPLFEYARSLGALAPHVALVHLTDAREPELRAVAASGARVVFCPRSNLYIEGKLPPLLAARTAGIAAALGTDSLASNASLDVLAEARALADRFPAVPAAELLAMATWNGARALGRDDLGRIARGANPGIAAVEGDPGDDPSAFLLRNVKAPRRWVVRRTRQEAHRDQYPNDRLAPRLSRPAPAPTARWSRSRTRSSRSRSRPAPSYSPAPSRTCRSRSLRVLAMLAMHGRARGRARWRSTRWADRDIDARNPRTKIAHVPSGVVKPRRGRSPSRSGRGSSSSRVRGDARLLASPLLAPLVLAVLLGYSLAKRFTWGAHAWLGRRARARPGRRVDRGGRRRRTWASSRS